MRVSNVRVCVCVWTVREEQENRKISWNKRERARERDGLPMQKTGLAASMFSLMLATGTHSKCIVYTEWITKIFCLWFLCLLCDFSAWLSIYTLICQYKTYARTLSWTKLRKYISRYIECTNFNSITEMLPKKKIAACKILWVCHYFGTYSFQTSNKIKLSKRKFNQRSTMYSFPFSTNACHKWHDAIYWNEWTSE